MARPTKEGLEYFPLDTDIDQDEKIIVVVAKYGMRGFGVIVRLMMEVYKNGYFYHWTEKEQYVFSMKVSEEVVFVNEVVDECLKWGFFHLNMHKQYGILTSKGFQKRYLLAANRRKGVQIKPDYNLIEEVSVSNNPENDDNNSDEEELPQAETLQKKRKEIKRNNTTSSRKKSMTYSEDDQFYKMAKYFHGKVESVAKEAGVSHLIAKANMQTWADDFRKLIDLDGVDKRLAKEVMDWIPTNTFWRKNILSAKKFREKFSKLAIEMSDFKKPKQPIQNQKSDPRDKELEFQQWVTEGKDPDEFDWGKSK